MLLFIAVSHTLLILALLVFMPAIIELYCDSELCLGNVCGVLADAAYYIARLCTTCNLIRKDGFQDLPLLFLIFDTHGADLSVGNYWRADMCLQ